MMVCTSPNESIYCNYYNEIQYFNSPQDNKITPPRIRPTIIRGGSGGVLSALMVVVTGAIAAKSCEEMSLSQSLYDNKMSVINDLKRQGINPNDSTIYSLYFSLNNDARSIYWADILDKPDIFAVVQIEGQSDFLIPNITNEYHGQPLLSRVISKNAKPGARVCIHIYDDDTASNRVWNRIIETKVNFNINGKAGYSNCLAAQASASGSIDLSGLNLEIDSPDHIAMVEFKMPSDVNEAWASTGILKDSNGSDVGKIEFSQVWRSDPQIVEDAAKARSSMIFWGIIAIVAAALCLKFFFMKSPDPAKD